MTRPGGVQRRCSYRRNRLGPAPYSLPSRSHAQEKNNEAAKRELTPLLAKADLDPLLRFQVRSLLGALDVASRIRPDHPRLFFNADTWPAVKARTEANAKEFHKLKLEAAALPDRAWRQRLGLRADASRSCLPRHGRPGPAGQDSQTAAGHRRPLPVAHGLQRTIWSRGWAVSAALDWVWNDLPRAEREGLTRDLLRYVCDEHAQDLLRGPKSVDHDPFYYYPEHVLVRRRGVARAGAGTGRLCPVARRARARLRQQRGREHHQETEGDGGGRRGGCFRAGLQLQRPAHTHLDVHALLAVGSRSRSG